VRGVWRTTAAMYGGMLFVHLLLLSAASGRPEHLTGGSHPASAGADLGMWGGLLLAAVQVALAGAVLASGRLREPQVDPVRVPAG
jgi:protein involved in temperature-dependent protein secretion